MRVAMAWGRLKQSLQFVSVKKNTLYDIPRNIYKIYFFKLKCTFLSLAFYYVFMRCCISNLITGEWFVCMCMCMYVYVNVATRKFSIVALQNEVNSDFLFGLANCAVQSQTAGSHSIFGQEDSISHAD